MFGHHLEFGRFQKRWVSLQPTEFVRNWSSGSVRINGRVSVYPLYPTYKDFLYMYGNATILVSGGLAYFNIVSCVDRNVKR